jgi:hypothetical protein
MPELAAVYVNVSTSPVELGARLVIGVVNVPRPSGMLTTAKLPMLVAVPCRVVTLTLPVSALAGTVAVILVVERTRKLALLPSTFTESTLTKCVPVIVIVRPTVPVRGKKL